MEIITDAPALPAAVPLCQNVEHDVWLENRRRGIGGSDVAALLGLSPWASKWSLWQDKTGQGKPLEMSEAMRWGTILEKPIAEEWERRHEKPVIGCPPGTIYQSTSYPLALASPDALTKDLASWIEIKAVSAHHADSWTDEEVPPHYWCQAQWEGFVAGVETVHLAALIGGQTLKSYVIPVDVAWGERTYEQASQFWENYVQPLVEPPVDDSDATTNALNHAFKNSERESIEGGSNLALAIADYLDASALEKEAKSKKQLAQNQIIHLLRGAEVGLVEGVPMVSYTTIERKSYVVQAGQYQKLALLKGAKN